MMCHWKNHSIDVNNLIKSKQGFQMCDLWKENTTMHAIRRIMNKCKNVRSKDEGRYLSHRIIIIIIVRITTTTTMTKYNIQLLQEISFMCWQMKRNKVNCV